MTYDSIRERVVVFGGWGSSGLKGTWEWDGANWELLESIHSPANNENGSMVFDNVRGRSVLWGGTINSSWLRNVWEWDGNDWREIYTFTKPSGRKGQAMAYDSKRGRVMLFGGYETMYGTELNDTWVYTGPAEIK